MPNLPSNLDTALQKKVFISTVGELLPMEARELDAFLLLVQRFCVCSLDSSEACPLGACAFVLSERIELDPVYEKHSGEFSQSTRLDQGEGCSIPGAIILTTKNLRLAFYKGCSDQTAVGVVAELNRLGLSDRPTCIFLPSQQMLTFHPRGVSNKPTFSESTDTLRKLNLNSIETVVTYYHERYTRFPDGLGPCWDNAGSRVVERHAERNIRNSLFVFLSMVVYRTSYVVREYQLPNGRVDIFIYGLLFTDQSARILEIKVLRSKTIGWRGGKLKTYREAAIKKYVEMGIRQAKRYMDIIGSKEGYLLCFDARPLDKEIDIGTYAVTMGVKYGRYFMESSTKDSSGPTGAPSQQAG